MDGRIDGRTDGRTDGWIVKAEKKSIELNLFSILCANNNNNNNNNNIRQ